MRQLEEATRITTYLHSQLKRYITSHTNLIQRAEIKTKAVSLTHVCNYHIIIIKKLRELRSNFCVNIDSYLFNYYAFIYLIK